MILFFGETKSSVDKTCDAFNENSHGHHQLNSTRTRARKIGVSKSTAYVNYLN